MAKITTCKICWRKAVRHELCLDHADEWLILTVLAALSELRDGDRGRDAA